MGSAPSLRLFTYADLNGKVQALSYDAMGRQTGETHTVGATAHSVI